MTMPTAGRDDGPGSRPGAGPGRPRRSRRLAGSLLAAAVAVLAVLTVVLAQAPGATAAMSGTAPAPQHVKPTPGTPAPPPPAVVLIRPGDGVPGARPPAAAIPTSTRPVVPTTTPRPTTTPPRPATGSGLPAPGETWVQELAVDGGDDVNVVAVAGAVRLADGVVRAQSARSPNIQGELLTAPRRVAAPVDRVAAAVTADVPPGAEVDVDVRGLRSDGTWSQWTPAVPNGPALLPEVTLEIQTRVTLVAGQFGAGPALQRLWMSADRTRPLPTTALPTVPPASPVIPTTSSAVPTTPSSAVPTTTSPAVPTTPVPTSTPLPTTSSAVPTTTTPVPTTTSPAPPTTTTPPVTTTPATTTTPVTVAPLTSRVYATRIGLVGNSTANGHVIVPRDHFVALPSRRGLAPKGTGDYTVKICAANARCAWAPVWDVGPWNITDDYWNSADLRQSWRDLAQGLPEAQAAFQQRYNGGRDGFGRTVANPAGIDLADGTYYDDLQLQDNSWVTVSYLWTGRGSSGVVVPANAPTLPVRSAPTDASVQVGAAAAAARVSVECSATGQTRTNSQGTSDQWLRIGPNQYIPAAGVEAPSAPSC